jgi:hypothetical protein
MKPNSTPFVSPRQSPRTTRSKLVPVCRRPLCRLSSSSSHSRPECRHRPLAPTVRRSTTRPTSLTARGRVATRHLRRLPTLCTRFITLPFLPLSPSAPLASFPPAQHFDARVPHSGLSLLAHTHTHTAVYRAIKQQQQPDALSPSGLSASGPAAFRRGCTCSAAAAPHSQCTTLAPAASLARRDGSALNSPPAPPGAPPSPPASCTTPPRQIQILRSTEDPRDQTD